MVSVAHNVGEFLIKYDPNVESLSVESMGIGRWVINITNDEQIRTKTPSVDSIIDYITSKPNFEHDNAVLHEHFLNRVIESRGDDKKLYFAFAAKVRKAKIKIESKYNGFFVITGTRELGIKKYVKIFTFKITGSAVLNTWKPKTLEVK